MTRLLSRTLSLGALVLAACGAPALYRPSSGAADIGYSEVEVAKNRYEVFFRGPADLEDADAKKFALIRAAEIGRQNGFAYFRVSSSKIRREAARDASLEPELFPQNPWTAENMTRAEREQRAWEDARRRQQRRRAAAVKDIPVVQLTVQYRDDDCDDCLSVAGKTREAADQGVLKP